MTAGNAGAADAHRTSPGTCGTLHRPSAGAPASTLAAPNTRRDSPAHVSSPAAAVSGARSPAPAAPSQVACRDRDRDRDSDSFASIVDDPFFQPFHSAFINNATLGSEASHECCAPAPEDNGHGITKTQQHWPPPRRESLTIGPPQSHRLRKQPRALPAMEASAVKGSAMEGSATESYNIAVVGTSAVGKSSFIQRVLGLPRPPVSNSSSLRILVDTVAHIVTLLELDLDHFELNTPQPISWPKQINGHIVPRLDAALILYDVMNQESIRELPQTVAALTKSGLSAVLVACKCESPQDNWAVDADAIANHKLFKPCIASYKVSMDWPHICRACLQTTIRAAVAHRRGAQHAISVQLQHSQEAADQGTEMVLRRRAQSAANVEAFDAATGRPLSDHGKHSRASSDFPALCGLSSPQTTTDSHGTQASISPWSGPGNERSGGRSFLELDESDGEFRRYSDDIPLLQRGDDDVIEKPPRVVGVMFHELIDRLLALPLSRADNNFSDIFLCLYRKFAAPGDVLSAILVRLDRVRDDKTSHYLTKTATQLRIIEVVAKWVSLYPGDFARPTTRRNLEDLITHLSAEPVFSIASEQMRRNLQFNVIVDDDTGWANADDAGDETASKTLSKEMSELSDGISTLQYSEEANSRQSNSSEISALDKASFIGGHTQFNSFDEYEREAALLEPRDHQPMNKFRYHIFMNISDDDIADELTRIDWTMFSSMRVRDFVRHVSLSAAQKEKCKSLRSVNRMINHFNHVAKWVAIMVLMRDKAKHRALMLEKFMNIALKLRQLNNYNGLAAVLAGLNGAAVHRLAQTRALVPPDVQKRFARLVILMGTQKSHFAYRLAWENSSLPRIPFIPLHRRDLVSAEEGSKTFVGPNGDRINWKKFEVLGEVLLPIMKSQGAAYPNLTNNETARDVILACRMPTDDEEIYQRSVQVESSSSGAPEPTKKKFPWFAK